MFRLDNNSCKFLIIDYHVCNKMLPLQIYPGRAVIKFRNLWPNPFLS